MEQIILSSDQARLLTESYPVAVVDEHGNVLGHIEPVGFTTDEIAAAKQVKDSAGPWYTGAEVAAHLAALERAMETEGALDNERAREVLAEARSAK